MAAQTALDDLIRRARKRYLWRGVLEQVPLAACLTMAGVIALLLLGTKMFNWPWLVLLFLGGLLTGVPRARCNVPPAYQIAREMDRHLRLDDTLSTAWFFEHMAGERILSSGFRETQRQAAELAARRVRLWRAVPPRLPKADLKTVLLVVAVLVLFGVRYALTGSLDLELSLVAAAVG